MEGIINFRKVSSTVYLDAKEERSPVEYYFA